MKKTRIALIVIACSPSFALLPSAGFAVDGMIHQAAPVCVGDCDDSSSVTVDEIVTGVGIALGSLPLEQCARFDCNGTRQVTVDCLIQAVDTALNGCALEPTASLTFTRTPTPTNAGTVPVGETVTQTPRQTASRAPTATPTLSAIRTATPSLTSTPSPTCTSTATRTTTATLTATATSTATRSATLTATQTLTGTPTPSATATAGDSLTVFDTRSAFASAAGALFTDDYEDPSYTEFQNDASMDAVKDLTRYKTTFFPDFDEVIATPHGHIYAGGFTSGSFQLDFTAPSLGGSGVHAVGFDFANNIPMPYIAFISFADGTSQNFMLPVSVFPFLTPLPDFFGLTSSVEITRIHVGRMDGGVTSDNLFAIDNLSVAAPET